MSQDQIMADLDGLIKKAAEVDSEGLAKSASPGDPLTSDNGTTAPETGAQMASNNEEAGKHTAAKVDGGAETNPAGASVTMSTEGATAASTDGQEGPSGADLEDKHQAANGDEGGLSGDPADLDKKTASELIGNARSLAGELKTAAESLPVDEAAEKATQKLASALGKSEGHSDSASAELTGFDRMLAKRAMEAALKVALPWKSLLPQPRVPKRSSLVSNPVPSARKRPPLSSNRPPPAVPWVRKTSPNSKPWPLRPRLRWLVVVRSRSGYASGP